MKYKRDIKACAEVVERLDVTGSPTAWLAEAAARFGATTLLAHADDGVVWGRIDNGRFITPFGGGAGAELRDVTLQEARVFGKDAEVLVWREAPGTYRGRVIRRAHDGERPSWEKAFDEPNLLWGQPVRALSGGFTLLSEGAMGHEHAPPVSLEGKQRAALQVRHFVGYDEHGVARMEGSRLVGITTIKD